MSDDCAQRISNDGIWSIWEMWSNGWFLLFDVGCHALLFDHPNFVMHARTHIPTAIAYIIPVDQTSFSPLHVKCHIEILHNFFPFCFRCWSSLLLFNFHQFWFFCLLLNRKCEITLCIREFEMVYNGDWITVWMRWAAAAAVAAVELTYLQHFASDKAERKKNSFVCYVMADGLQGMARMEFTNEWIRVNCELWSHSHSQMTTMVWPFNWVMIFFLYFYFF